MRLYLLERTDKVDYDEYDSFVVAANTPEEAHKLTSDTHSGEESDIFTTWPLDFDLLEVTTIGQAAEVYDSPTIILGSFNAG